MLILLIFVPTLGAVFVACMAEYFDPSLRTTEQTEQELGIPVLFSVPRDQRHELLPK
jgi:capsular polysaccharide biosynthesis protein